MSWQSTSLFKVPRKPVNAVKYNAAARSSTPMNVLSRRLEEELDIALSNHMDNSTANDAPGFAQQQTVLLDHMLPMDLSGALSQFLLPAESNSEQLRCEIIPSKEIDQKSLQNRTRRHCGPLFGEGWTLEIISWFVGAACISTIVVVLSEYNQRPLTHWPYTFVTLNTFVSTFSTLAKAALMFVVAQCLGQLKWSWYSKKPAPLDNFDIFDSASRGAIGSFKLLGLTKGLRLPSLGAFITIAAVATSPFSQQVVTYNQRQTLGGNSSLPRSLSWMSAQVASNLTTGSNNTSLQAEIGSKTYQSVYQAIFSTDAISPVFSPICSTGNCTWPSYNSLAICSSRENITHLLQNDQGLYGLYFSDNSSITAVDMGAGAMIGQVLDLASASTNDLLTAYFLPPWDSELIASASYVVYYDAELQSVQAFQFNLTYCVQTYNTKEFIGHDTTEVLGTYELDNGLIMVKDDSNLDFYLTAIADNTTYYLEQNFRINLCATLGMILSGTVLGLASTWTASHTVGFEWGQGSTPAGDGFASIYNQNVPSPSDTISMIFENIATSLSNSFLTIPSFTTPVVGNATSFETYVDVRWEWLIYLLSILFLTSIFLLFTMLEHYSRRDGHGSRRTSPHVGLWKNSALAALWALSCNDPLHREGNRQDGSPDEGEKGNAFLGAVDEMTAFAGGVWVKLRKLDGVEDRWVLGRENV